ncbi:MAG: hypothetical protein JW778_01665 [Candidatus Altiarchaeota archaeon]|nr:hypothetical protein [Candidatus Altiarchaeota archaeon]
MEKRTLAVLCIFLIALGSAQSQGYITLENKHIARMEVTDLLVEDVDDNVGKEILVTSYDSKLYLLDSKVNQKWVYDARSYVYSVATVDLEKDGIKEIVVGAASLRVLDLNGTVITKVKTDNDVKKIVVEDFDGDGSDDIIAGAGSVRSHTVYIFDKDLEVIWQQTIRGDFPWGMAVYDTNKDGKKEVILAGSQVFTYDADRNILWSYGLDGSAYDLKVEDIDGDGEDEILVGSYPDLTVLKTNGELKWEYKTEGIVRSVHVTDLEEDGKKEIILASDKVYALDANGKELWTHNTTDKVYFVHSGDLDWDGVKEIAAASKKIYVLGKDGEEQWTYDPYRTSTELYIGDVDNDGRNDLIVSGADHTVYLFKAREIYIKERQTYTLYEEAETLYNEGRYEEARERIEQLTTTDAACNLGKCQEDPQDCDTLKQKIMGKITTTTRTQPVVMLGTTTSTTEAASETTTTQPTKGGGTGILLPAAVLLIIVVAVAYKLKKK